MHQHKQIHLSAECSIAGKCSHTPALTQSRAAQDLVFSECMNRRILFSPFSTRKFNLLFVVLSHCTMNVSLRKINVIYLVFGTAKFCSEIYYVRESFLFALHAVRQLYFCDVYHICQKAMIDSALASERLNIWLTSLISNCIDEACALLIL